MSIRLMRVNSDARPHVRVALGDRNDVAPFPLPRGDVEEALNATLAGVRENLVLPLDEAFVVEMAMAIDQPHSAASASSSSSLGNKGVGWAIGVPRSPASISVRSLSVDVGMIGAIA